MAASELPRQGWETVGDGFNYKRGAIVIVMLYNITAWSFSEDSPESEANSRFERPPYRFFGPSCYTLLCLRKSVI